MMELKTLKDIDKYKEEDKGNWSNFHLLFDDDEEIDYEDLEEYQKKGFNLCKKYQRQEAIKWVKELRKSSEAGVFKQSLFLFFDLTEEDLK